MCSLLRIRARQSKAVSALSGRHGQPDSAHDLDARHEWRRLFAEAWGTFLLVFIAAGGDVIAAWGGDLTPGMRAIAPGLMVMVVIYMLGAVSGAHLNPTITFAFATRGNFPWRRVPGYVVAQTVGGLAAVFLLKAFFGKVGELGATMPGSGVSVGMALAMEIVLTTGLVTTVLATATRAHNIGPNGAIAVGGYIALAALVTAPISGASMNPVRSLAPDLVRGDFGTTWIYVAGPLAGALIGVCFEWLLKGKATAAGTLTAQGSICDDTVTREEESR